MAVPQLYRAQKLSRAFLDTSKKEFYDITALSTRLASLKNADKN